MSEHYVEIHGRRVRYVDVGAGPIVLFASGLGISADFYRPNMEFLADAGFRAITPDLPGFGKTRGPVFGSSTEAIVEHLVAFARALDIERAAWVGHSIGCQAVLHIAAEHASLARAIVLAGPTGGAHHRLSHQVRALSVHAVTEPWRLLKAVLRDYVRLSPLSYLGTWIKAAADDPLAQAPRVQCPALILLGAHDRVPGKDFIAQLAECLPDVRVEMLPVGQHGLPVDARAEFDRALVGFLSV